MKKKQAIVEVTIMGKLKQLRCSHNLTQSVLAEMLNVDRSSYAYYESGKTMPSLMTLAKLSKLYNVPIEYFLSGEERGSFPLVDFFMFTAKEKKILFLFRLLDNQNKDDALQYLQGLSESKDAES